ncbi:MAG TPA: DUF1646 family protein [Firmicutes bacterium]|nr:DUF1646 family protein [Bacillota bacterium]
MGILDQSLRRRKSRRRLDSAGWSHHYVQWGPSLSRSRGGETAPGRETREGDELVIIGLTVILLLVLALPFAVRAVEHNLEPFLFVMGLAATIISGTLSGRLFLHALREPIFITAAVLVAGLLFKLLQHKVGAAVEGAARRLSMAVFCALMVVVLGMLSSVITAIIASLVLVEVVHALPISRPDKIRLDVLACFAIGLGAALTPIGEPLSTIAISKLGQTFWFLAGLLGKYIVPGIIALALLTGYLLRKSLQTGSETASRIEPETYTAVIVRAAKVYLFVMALVLLGEGFKPVIEAYILKLPPQALYWINTISAVVDNATLTAAEIEPHMSNLQVEGILMGLLIAGGMLIPGNIPNIVSAGKLGIGSREWARLGVPLGLILMVVYYVILFVL